VSKISVLVEGQTEEAFVKEVLVDHLAPKGIAIVPTILETSRTHSSLKHKGGMPKYEKIRKDIAALLRDTGTNLVTTMFDYYGLRPDFPGNASVSLTAGCRQRVKHLETALAADIGRARFEPYLMTHEFEAFLFVDVGITAELIALSSAEEQAMRSALGMVAGAFSSPEEINTTVPPSKRLIAVCPRYEKPLFGPVVAGIVGVDALKAGCERFSEWMAVLESHAEPERAA
jgi:hypothetical protein